MTDTPNFNNQATLDILNDLKKVDFSSLSFEAKKEELRKAISKIVVDVPTGSSQLLYSGNYVNQQYDGTFEDPARANSTTTLNRITSGDIASEIAYAANADGVKISIIDNSDIGKFINSKDFKNLATSKVYGGDKLKFEADLYAVETSGGGKGYWAEGSHNFAKSGSGNIITLTAFADSRINGVRVD